MNTHHFGLSIALVSLLSTLAGCSHLGPAAATPAAGHPVVDFAVPAYGARAATAERPARFETAPMAQPRMVALRSGKR
ncbi:MAG TPA: hypothetical protein VIF15_18890 [Polyangiaceae bacterium]